MLGASPPGLFAMECSRLYLNRLQNQAAARDTAVVIDVLRSFTTAAVALARGARAIYPVEGATAAQLLAAELPQPLRVGAVGGGAPMPGFDLGNSPAALLQEELAGREVVLSTAAGVRGLQRFRQARRLYAASLVCARATAAAIRADGTRAVCFVITGEWVDRDGDEDLACADYLEALLRDPATDPAPYIARVRASDFGRRFSAGSWEHLPPADLELATRADCYDFPMPVTRSGDRLVIRAPG